MLILYPVGIGIHLRPVFIDFALAFVGVAVGGFLHRQVIPGSRQIVRPLVPPFQKVLFCPLSRIDGQKNIRYNGKGTKEMENKRKKG